MLIGIRALSSGDLENWYQLPACSGAGVAWGMGVRPSSMFPGSRWLYSQPGKGSFRAHHLGHRDQLEALLHQHGTTSFMASLVSRIVAQDDGAVLSLAQDGFTVAWRFWSSVRESTDQR